MALTSCLLAIGLHSSGFVSLARPTLRTASPFKGSAKACEAQTLEELIRHDLLAYVGTLRDEILTPRTIANRLSFLMTLFRDCEVTWPLMKTDRAKFTEKQVEAYSVEVLQKLFEEADQDEYDLLQFLLCAGDRPFLCQF